MDLWFRHSFHCKDNQNVGNKEQKEDKIIAY